MGGATACCTGKEELEERIFLYLAAFNCCSHDWLSSGIALGFSLVAVCCHPSSILLAFSCCVEMGLFQKSNVKLTPLTLDIVDAESNGLSGCRSIRINIMQIQCTGRVRQAWYDCLHGLYNS